MDVIRMLPLSRMVMIKTLEAPQPTSRPFAMMMMIRFIILLDVFIIDVVITTGTTVVQVAAALKRCGVGEISVCALAATMPRQVN